MKNSSLFTFFMVLLLGLGGCIGDDIIQDEIDPVLRIMNPVDTIEINTSYQYEATYFNNVGQQEANSITWTSSDESIVSIDADGVATANEIGNVTVRAETTTPDGLVLSEESTVVVGNSTVIVNEARTGSLETTTFYTLDGDFTLEDDGDILVLSFAENYSTSSGLPGLYIYLTNNPNSIAGAFEIGRVDIFNGAHTYEIDAGLVGLTDYEFVLYFCKPFNVKIGAGQFDN